MDRRLAALAAIPFFVFAFHASFPSHRLVVRVFDVGQGDAILAQCGRHQLLVDGGPDAAVLAKLGRAMPFFDRRIDAVVLTHPHLDHYAGLVAVLRRYRVDRLFVSGAPAGSPGYGAFEDASAAAKLAPTPLLAGDLIRIGDCGKADALWPAPGAAAAVKKDPHDAVIVLRVTVPAPASPTAAVLLMGDPTAEVERTLVGRGAPVAADVLKVGHHGSRFANTGAFLDAVRPAFAVISCGRRNRYGHPHDATILRLAARRAAVVRTDLAGDVTVRVDPDRAYVAGY